MMTMDDKVSALAGGVFSELEDAVLTLLAERMGTATYDDGEVIFLQGEPGREIFFITSGEVEILREGKVLARLGPGEIVGEMSVLGGELRNGTGRAKGTLEVLFLHDKALRLLIQQVPDLAFALFRVLIRRLEDANELTMMLSREPYPKARINILSGDLAGQNFTIFRESSIIGRSRGTLVSDGLRLALPSRDKSLEEEHARVDICEGTIFIMPLKGQVFLGSDMVEERLALEPQDTVTLGGLTMHFELTPGKG